MANRATQSLTTGMKILGGANIPTYTLEYLTPTNRKKQGAFETIVVPYIELGRDKSCAVQFGDDTPTVSRKHCAIERKGEEVSIINLSTSNPTLVNGRPVNDRYFLNNGDEIQLSMEGPRLRYNTTKTGTAKIGFTNKINLVMQQAIRPYKVAAVTFLMIFLLTVTGAGIAIYQLSDDVKKQEAIILAQMERLAQQETALSDVNQRNEDLVRNVEESRNQFAAERERLRRSQEQLAADLAAQRARSDSLMRVAATAGRNYADIIEPLKKYVFALRRVKVGVVIDGREQIFDLPENQRDVNCTGFLINNGSFVTARHCFDAIFARDLTANFLDNNGTPVTFYHTAESYDGSIKFEFTSKQMRADYSRDPMVEYNHEGELGMIRIPRFFNGSDWAYMPVSIPGGLEFDKPLSGSMRNGTDLFVLGFSYGTDYRYDGNLEPYFTTAKVTLSGLQNGMIQVTEAGYDGGNSGGPVFTMVNGVPTVVALVTGAYMREEATAMGDEYMRESSINVVTPLVHF